MPIQMSMIKAMELGLDDLMPDEFKWFASSIESNPTDESVQLKFANWLSIREESELQYGLQWCVARHISPMKRGDKWDWARWWEPSDKIGGRSVVPEWAKYKLESCKSSSFMGVIAKTAKALLEYREELFGIAPRQTTADDALSQSKRPGDVYVGQVEGVDCEGSVPAKPEDMPL